MRPEHLSDRLVEGCPIESFGPFLTPNRVTVDLRAIMDHLARETEDLTVGQVSELWQYYLALRCALKQDSEAGDIDRLLETEISAPVSRRDLARFLFVRCLD